MYIIPTYTMYYIILYLGTHNSNNRITIYAVDVSFKLSVNLDDDNEGNVNI